MKTHWFPLIRPAIRAGYFLGVPRGIGRGTLDSHDAKVLYLGLMQAWKPWIQSLDSIRHIDHICCYFYCTLVIQYVFFWFSPQIRKEKHTFFVVELFFWGGKYSWCSVFFVEGKCCAPEKCRGEFSLRYL